MPRPKHHEAYKPLAPGRWLSRTAGWVMGRVACTAPDGSKRDAREASAAIAGRPWAAGARYLGLYRGWHCFEHRP